MKIVFAGTPDFAVPALRKIAEQHQLIGVLTQPDRPAGRGRKVIASAVKQAALELDVPVFQPKSLRRKSARQLLQDLQPDLMVVAAYGLILPQSVLDIPVHGCWNIHASLLPRWRGAAPIQRALLVGDAETGISIMQMDAGLDTGDLLHTVSTPILAEDTGGSLHDRLAILGSQALLDCSLQLAAGRPPGAIPQPEQGVCYAGKLDKQEAEIDWQQDAVYLARQVRAFNPWPVAWSELAGERLRIWQASAVGSSAASAAADPGQVVWADQQGIRVACGAGELLLQQVQKAGGRVVSARDYLNARQAVWPGQ